MPGPSGIVMPTRSPRNASYTITAQLDPGTRTLRGSEVIVWRNVTANPTRELRFHTYWNAWRDEQSTFLRERALLRTTSYDEDEFARLDITTLRVVSTPPSLEHDEGDRIDADLTSTIEFIAPDDGNRDDATVMRVLLPASIGPGGTARIEVNWIARVPRPFARTGVIGNFYFLAQWFPKLGVLEDAGWNSHQFHATTEFFADFGVYDVTLTVPRGWMVGATGAERARSDNGDGTTTHAYYQEDVHDFAWTTSPDMVERVADFVPSGSTAGPDPAAQKPVRLRLLLQPEHTSQAEAHFSAARTALKYYSEWFGAYPYDQLTIVDPAFQSASGGMEYPTLITGGTTWLQSGAVTSDTPEEVVIHEAGHQFFYGVVASNEFEDAWMDEGINTYLTARALVQDHPHTYLERRFFGDFVPWTFTDLEVSRGTYWNRLPGYRRAPKSDIPAMPSYRYSVSDGRTVTYNKTALWLHVLETHLTWPVMRQILETYYQRWQFRHPKPADFFAIVNEVAGRDMTWFFDEVYRSSNVFDYAIGTLRSNKEGDIYRTDVIVSRVGEARFPVDVALVFEDGARIVERWDGPERWQQFSVMRPARAVSAEADPQSVLLLDVNRTNNSQSLRPATSAAATKWSLRWLLWLQQSLLTWAFLA